MNKCCKSTSADDRAPKKYNRDRILSFWEMVQPYLFPFAPESTESFISSMFWHSMILTASTPLHRYVSGEWKGVSTLFWILESYAPQRIVDFILKRNGQHIGVPYPKEGEVIPGFSKVEGIDKAFGIHAFFALLWLVVAYVQIVHARNIHPKMHRYLGWISIFVFLGHSFGALHAVYNDIVQHTAIVKLMFVVTALDHLSQFFRSMYYAIRRTHPSWMRLHQDQTVLLFLGSIGGAGPIRAVAEIQTLLGVGTAICQAQYNGMATHCQTEYMSRLVLVGLWCYYMKGTYVAMRKDDDLTRQYVAQATTFVIIAALVIAFGFVPRANEHVILLFGEARSFRGNVIVAFGSVLAALYEISSFSRFMDQHNKSGTTILRKAGKVA